MKPPLIISRADEVIKILQQRPIAAVLSIEHPEVKEGEKGAAPRIANHGFDHVPQCILAFWDSEQVVKNGPDRQQVETGIHFVLEHWEKGDILIHCHSGKARSTGIALGALGIRYPEMTEKELVETILAIRPIAAPNIIVVEMSDEIASRQGKLLKAILDNEQISRQRAIAENNRQWMIKKNPELMRKLHPEKFPKP